MKRVLKRWGIILRGKEKNKEVLKDTSFFVFFTKSSIIFKIFSNKKPMNDFTYHNPTKIYFGKKALDNLTFELKNYWKNVLLAYWWGSIKKIWLYDKVINILKENDKNIFELTDIMPNPRTEKVYEWIKICKENNIDLILAVWWGSTIDCCKAIGIWAKTDKDFWETFYINWETPESTLPLWTILTLSATGSEMDDSAVITHWEQKIKKWFMTELMFPKFSILNPEFTYSVPKEQIAYWSVDILSHIFEAYFSLPNDSNLSDDISEAIIKNLIKNVRIALKNPEDYNARANLMWDSSMALNKIIWLWKNEDWQVHKIEHTLSAFYDIPHWAWLAIVTPSYFEYIYKDWLSKFVQYAKNIWNVDVSNKTDEEIALEWIQKTREFFKEIWAPTTLREVNIPKTSIDEMAKMTDITNTWYKKLSEEDIKNILLLAY